MSRRLLVYCCAPDVPIQVCKDARLRGGSGTKNEVYGQAGWDWGVNYRTFHELALTLTSGSTELPDHLCGGFFSWDCQPPRAGEIGALAIMAHGAPGLVDLDSTSTSAISSNTASSWYNPIIGPADGLRATTIRHFHKQFALLDKAIAHDGLLYFMSCRAGQDKEGTQLLVEVSKLLPGREIIGYTTIGYASGGGQKRAGDLCEPGMRDTPFFFGIGDARAAEARAAPLWSDLKKMPWASRYSPHAKVVKDGVVLRHGNPAVDGPQENHD